MPEGEDIILPVKFQSSSKVIIEWTKDEKKIRKSARIKIKEEGTSTEVQIKSAVKSDDGTYQLLLTHFAGELKAICNVVVHGTFLFYFLCQL